MIRLPPGSTRTDTLFPYTTLFRSAQRSFCSRANEIAQIVSSTPSAQVVEQAPANLAKLDEPFVDFYESYAKYQAEVAAWDAKYAPPPVMTTPTPASAIPVRSEERRLGKGCVSTCSSRGSPNH